ncbi:unnamed protein product [Caenorhabditis auriculariae]|uniref:Ubiquitin-like domain-containing protein n=1 Tax=Caenorhabditis auriculariae TaxID=2777116 RepID=A0A8S1H2X2_9PELO|nr:unnamed protein product [Caenorhabditis auriculariae]
MSTDLENMIVYIKNDRGVTLPMYIKKTDRVELIWSEMAGCSSLHEGSLCFKALFNRGRRLERNDVVGEVGIQHYDTIKLQSLKPHNPLPPKQLSEPDFTQTEPKAVDLAAQNLAADNDRGVALPIVVSKKDRVEKIWAEVAGCSAIHDKSLVGKALFYKGRRLHRHDIIGHLDINYYDTIRFQSLSSCRPPSLKQMSEAFDTVPTHPESMHKEI